jgi:acyl-CoA synthetase (AMP-forming)/AMP-acid ligase II
VVEACVVVPESHSVSEEELRDFVRVRLADYKVPERVSFLPALPKGPTGKVDRRALAEMRQN